ncbi:phosphomevalonate kinase [Streptococcus pluranimalium]|uniref:phosphomevalonate kinase n=1 Tax=Streptococcus pluranimalium TaxID=82348 RepID=A0A345VJ86_9STRE|nr:phosphomevalonate kinase [Streptococcus pluranimalium]AXJ12788.1 Phosphomevalonate kinase [Streptococcus pluranimalium]
MKKISVQAGGKLYLAGEYAILTPGQTAIIKNIPIYMTAQVREANQLQLKSDMFDYAVDMSADKGYALIQESVLTFALFLGKTVEALAPFELSISGKLEKNGKKFGIGSSGSVTVLTIKALAAFFDIPLTKDQLFKLAAYTLLKLGDNGSMGDIACIAYNDLVAYTSFDREAISDLILEKSLTELLAMDWGYEIVNLVPQLKADFLVGWTAQPALSSQMIKDLKSHLSVNFLSQTQKQVLALKSALQAGDRDTLVHSLETVSDLLVSLSPAIYTDKLKALKEAAEGLEVVAKSSGAGGGDCGIAISLNPAHTTLLKQRWKDAEIDLLYQESWSTCQI